MENKRDMEVVILAGGMGTRLSQVVKDIPKPMAPVNGKPFLFFVLDWLIGYPVEKIILLERNPEKDITDKYVGFIVFIARGRVICTQMYMRRLLRRGGV